MLLSRLSSNQTNPWFNFFIIEQIKSLKSIWLFGESSLFTFWFLMHVKNVIIMLNWFRISKLRMHWIVRHNLRITCLSSYWTHIIGSWITWVPHTHTRALTHPCLWMYTYIDTLTAPFSLCFILLVTRICHLQLLLTRILKEPRGRMIQIIQQWVVCFNAGIIYFLLYASNSWHSWLQIFVGGLDTTVTDDLLRQVFSRFGELVHVKIPVGKRCGFVQFANR